jgi:hypothetical protein
MNDEKICPLTQRTCYRKECGMWHITGCSATALVRNLNTVAMEIAMAKAELYWIRKELENK